MLNARVLDPVPNIVKMADGGVEGTIGNVEIQVEQIVTFDDEGAVESTTNPLPTPMPQVFAASAREGREHTVVDFLNRPMLLKNFKWKQTDTFGTDLFKIDFPNDLLGQPAMYEKIKGFTWFRGDMVLRVNVNAQKFQQGRLMIWFRPYFNMIAPTSPAFSMTTKSGYPRVDFDLSQSQSMTITVPYVAPVSHLNLIKEDWSIGSVFVTVYGELAGGDAEIGGSVWGHFENIELQLPTGVIPYVTPVTAPFSMVYSKTIAQANLKGEKAASSGGPISGAAKAVGKIASVASMIPGISTVAAPIAAVAGVVGNLASAFGFSKPTTEKIYEPFQVSTSRNANNFNGVDLSKKLALDATNNISIDPIFGTTVDELSLAYIAGTPNYYAQFEFNKTQAAGTVLYEDPVSPIGFIENYKGYEGVYSPTHLGYIASMFDFWSGAIKYKLRFVKTKFHSGRICVHIVPLGVVGTTFSTFDSNKVIKYNIDLKDRSEFEFEVPFTWSAPMMPTGGLGGNIPILDPPAHSSMIITVINELVIPSTLASDKIQVLVERAGGDDITFYAPSTIPGALVWKDSGPPVPPKKTNAQADQPGDASREDVQLGRDNPTPLFNTDRLTSPTDSLGCVGETIVSARQLLKRFQEVALATNPATNFKPYVSIGLVESTAIADETMHTDYFTAFNAIFAFMRGGMRLKLFYNSAAANPFYDRFLLGGVSRQGGPNVSLINTGIIDITNYRADVPNVPVRDGCMEVEVPFYSQYPLAPTSFFEVSFNSPHDGSNPGRLRECTHANEGSEATRIVYRAVAEDFQMGFLIGVPPMVIKYS